MLRYILRRVLLLFPTLIGITLVVFLVMAASPGGIGAQPFEGQDLQPEARKAMQDYYNRIYGLDAPLAVQYLRWLNNISPIGFTQDDEFNIDGFSLTKGSNLGRSFRYGRPVLDLLKERVPITLLLNVLALPLIYLIAVSVGVHAASTRGGPFDVGLGVVMLALWSVPTMLAAVLVIGFFAGDQHWHWFPTTGLSRREALDMPFMPHWSSLRDVALLCVSAIGGGVGAGALSRYAGRRVRTGGMAVLGLALGVTMALSHASTGFHIAYVSLSLLIAVLFALIGYMDYRPFRTMLMALIGLALGIGLGVSLMQGEFVRGWLLDRLWHLVLPVFVLSYGGYAFLSRLTRSAVLENLQSDFARTARAKGLTEQEVLWRHVFRNSLLPLITVSAGLLPALLSGSVIVETVFGIDGMGRLAIEAVYARDRELVLSITLISAVLTLLGYLLADILYAVADPRVSYE